MLAPACVRIGRGAATVTLGPAIDEPPDEEADIHAARGFPGLMHVFLVPDAISLCHCLRRSLTTRRVPKGGPESGRTATAARIMDASQHALRPETPQQALPSSASPRRVLEAPVLAQANEPSRPPLHATDHLCSSAQPVRLPVVGPSSSLSAMCFGLRSGLEAYHSLRCLLPLGARPEVPSSCAHLFFASSADCPPVMPCAV